MTRWKIVLGGANAYIPLFPTAFVGTQLRVTRDSDGLYYLTADSLDVIEDIEIARAHAHQLVETLNGLAELIWPGFVPKCSTPYMIGRPPDGTEHRVICAVPRIGIVIGGDPTGVLDRLVDEQGHEFPGRVRPSVLDRIAEPIVRDALRLLGTDDDPSWTTLYKVLELIGRDLGNERSIIERGWASRKQIERFRHSANNWQASGLDARHAIEWRPPQDAMLIQEARQFIRELVSKWLVRAPAG